MTIQFYGAPMSSASRTHVMLEECGVPFEYHRVNNRDPEAKAAYLKINPSGKIPFLVDGDLQLVESVAINFYLAEKYAPQLWSTDVAERARIYSWSLWGISTLQHDALRVMHHSMIVPPEHRSLGFPQRRVWPRRDDRAELQGPEKRLPTHQSEPDLPAEPNVRLEDLRGVPGPRAQTVVVSCNP